MAYLHIGQNVMLEDKRIIGIFDYRVYCLGTTKQHLTVYRITSFYALDRLIQVKSIGRGLNLPACTIRILCRADTVLRLKCIL